MRQHNINRAVNKIAGNGKAKVNATESVDEGVKDQAEQIKALNRRTRRQRLNNSKKLDAQWGKKEETKDQDS
jgi:hypothetical protein